MSGELHFVKNTICYFMQQQQLSRWESRWKSGRVEGQLHLHQRRVQVKVEEMVSALVML